VLSELLHSDTECAVWWATVIECQSALLRHHREGRVPPSLLERAMRRLGELIDDADVIAPTSPLRDRAGRLLAAHPLRAADALQLAAALAWCDDVPRDEAFVSLDDRLRQAAAREGFTVLPP
jgi:predicted nucleic acid-binding protein